MRAVVLVALLLWSTPTRANEEPIPCAVARAALVWALGNEAKAEKIARRYGYSKAQIEDAKRRCR